jgi:hypothetical protein
MWEFLNLVECSLALIGAQHVYRLAARHCGNDCADPIKQPQRGTPRPKRANRAICS